MGGRIVQLARGPTGQGGERLGPPEGLGTAGRGGPPAHLSSGGGRRSRWSSLTYTWQVEQAREASQAPAGDR